VLPLHLQDVAQPLLVVLGEPAVARRCTVRRDQALRLQKPDLGNGDVGEVHLHGGQDLPDAAQLARCSHHPTPCWLAKKVSRNLPIITTSPSCSSVGASITVRFTYVPFRLPWSSTVTTSPLRVNTACLRDTVMSSRKMSVAGCRPTVVTSAAIRNRSLRS